MKLFVDEDTGARVARALAELGEDVKYIGGRRAPRRGTVDERWNPLAARDGRLILSRNLRILITDAEVDILVREKVGIVFLPQHIDRLSLMRLLMRYWDRLEKLDEHEPRPFAYFLGTAGRLSRLPLVGDSAGLRRRLSRFVAEWFCRLVTPEHLYTDAERISRASLSNGCPLCRREMSFSAESVSSADGGKAVGCPNGCF